MPGKRVQFDDETWAALDMLARDRMMDFPELADEAFRYIFNNPGRKPCLMVALPRRAGVPAHMVPLKPKPPKNKTSRKKRR